MLTQSWGVAPGYDDSAPLALPRVAPMAVWCGVPMVAPCVVALADGVRRADGGAVRRTAGGWGAACRWGWGAFSDGHTLGEPVPVFPRIERAEVAAD